jgi:hypothetical protein
MKGRFAPDPRSKIQDAGSLRSLMLDKYSFEGENVAKVTFARALVVRYACAARDGARCNISTYIQHPVSSILHPVSCILYPVSCILHLSSSIQHPASSFQYPDPQPRCNIPTGVPTASILQFVMLCIPLYQRRNYLDQPSFSRQL